MGVTVLLGAGAVLEIGAPSTWQLTEGVRRLENAYAGNRTKFIEKVAADLDRYYGRDTANFEDIFHALEQIDTYQAAWSSHAAKSFKPVFGAFSQPIDETIFSNSIDIMQAKQGLINYIAEQIDAYDSDCFTKQENAWYGNFWRQLNSRSLTDFITLNYDSTLEQLLPDAQNGFETTEHNFKRFNPGAMSGEKARIIHLHGCIRFGYARTPDINQYTMEDDHEDLYLFPSFKEARHTWSGRSGHTSQSGDRATIGPIITGLNKTDKLQAMPYTMYQAELIDAIRRNQSLLIVGYSFGDLYINNIIERMLRIHGKDRRIVFIDKAPSFLGYYLHQWVHEMPRGMFMSLARAFNVSQFFPSDVSKTYYRSKGNNALLFPHGFKAAVTNYGDEIMDFLNHH